MAGWQLVNVIGSRCYAQSARPLLPFQGRAL